MLRATVEVREDDVVLATVWDGEVPVMVRAARLERTTLEAVALAASECFGAIAGRLREEEVLQPEGDWWTTVR